MTPDERAVAEGCTLDLAKAERVREFLRRFLRHSKGQWAGKPFELLDWQWERIVKPLYGWVRPDGTRRFRRAGIWIPKKNGKSTLLSGLALYHLVADGEPGAEVYCAANDRDQASIIFGESANMVENSPLGKFINLVRSKKEMVFRDGKYKALSSDVPTKEGLNASASFFDEIHAAPKRDLYDTLRYAGIARSQPLEITISTAGYDQEGIGYELYHYACQVRDGKIDDPYFFAFIAEASGDDDWGDPNVWAKANPSLGVTINLDEMRASYEEAKASPAKENTFRRYRLNQWTKQQSRWIPIKLWDNCKQKEQPAVKAECFGGLDLSAKIDLSAFVLCFATSDGNCILQPYFWVPRSALDDRRRSDKLTSFDKWVDAGFIKVTPGNVIDYDQIESDIVELSKVYKIKEVAFDPWNAMSTALRLQKQRIKPVEFRQGFASFNDPCKEFEAFVRGKKIVHNANPVLRWNLDNVAIVTDPADNYKPSKKHSAEKIDGIVAAIMAFGRWRYHVDCRTIYGDRGLRTI